MRQLRLLRALLRSMRGGPGHDGPPSDHFDGRYFFNAHAPAGRTLADLLRWQRTAQRKRWPAWVENRARPALPTRLTHVGARQVFFAGDTGYSPHFKAIRERHGAVDLALLPIGAYEPRWFMRDQHMDPDDAIRAHLDLQAKLSVGTHFGCFQLTDEGIDDPVIELEARRQHHNVAAESFQVLETGETRVFDRELAQEQQDSASSELRVPI